MTTLVYETLSEVPQELRDAAKEGDNGKFSVKVAPAERITEFRDNNVSLSQERDSLLADLSRYEGVTGVTLAEISTLDDFATTLSGLRETSKRVEDGVLVENTSLDEAAASRVTEVTANFKDQLATMAKERDVYKDKANKSDSRANSMVVENAVRLAASDPDVAMLDSAVGLILHEAYNTFRVEDGGTLVAKSPEGAIAYGSDGVSPMTMKEWLLKQRETSEFLFKGSKGGGALGAADVIGRISSADLAKMSPSERINYARKHNAA